MDFQVAPPLLCLEQGRERERTEGADTYSCLEHSYCSAQPLLTHFLSLPLALSLRRAE
jgi:hypothetical protein